MWSEKTSHMVQNWYCEILVSCEILNYPLSRTFYFYLDLLWYWYQKLLMFKGYKNIKKNIIIELLFSFTLQFHPLRHVAGFPRSHHISAYRHDKLQYSIAAYATEWYSWLCITHKYNIRINWKFRYTYYVYTDRTMSQIARYNHKIELQSQECFIRPIYCKLLLPNPKKVLCEILLKKLLDVFQKP